MANILGSLFVELRANTANFAEGMTKASVHARRTGKEIEDVFGRLGSIASRAFAPLGEAGEKLAATFENVGNAVKKGIGSMGALGGIMGGITVGAVGVGAAIFAAAEK